MEIIKYYCDACGKELQSGEIRKMFITDACGERTEVVYDLCRTCSEIIKGHVHFARDNDYRQMLLETATIR